MPASAESLHSKTFITAGPRAFSLTSRITQRDAGTGCGHSGHRHPPRSRRTEPQPAGHALTFPGCRVRAWPPDGVRPAGWSRAEVPGRPGARAQVRDLTRDAG